MRNLNMEFSDQPSEAKEYDDSNSAATETQSDTITQEDKRGELSVMLKLLPAYYK